MSRSDLSHHPIICLSQLKERVYLLLSGWKLKINFSIKFIYLLRGGCQPVDYKPYALPFL